MSLFGYKKNTNPLLSSLKNDPNFNWLPGISGGVSTTVSTALLINGIYEPNNYKALEDKKANLFKLAKQHNFKNFYISAQTGALLANLSSENIDYTIFRKKAPLLFSRYQDEALLKIIPDLDYADKNFIVINQRNAHAPYESNYQHDLKLKYFPVNDKNYQQFLIDTYDNAMLYNDYIIYGIIDFYRNKFKGPTYIFFTSDHGEGLGPVYGHSILDRSVAQIPFMSYIINGKNEVFQTPICHYEVNNAVARALGFNIINPNLKPGTCYIQGTDLYGLNEYIEFKK
jgi:heptose-I-phosphate ethanolaminephosphotransferase